MRVLFVTPYLPSPPGFGGQRRLHGLISEVAKQHEVSVLSLCDPRQNMGTFLNATREYSRRVEVVKNPRQEDRGLRKRLWQLGSLFTPFSYERLVYREGPMQRMLDELCAREKYDLVQVEFAQMACYRIPRDRRGRPVLCLDEHNVEYDILRRTAAGDVGVARRLYSEIDWRKLRVEELRAWRDFDGAVVTSDRDERLVRSASTGTKTAIVPNGVDVDAFAPEPGTAKEPDTVLFFGALSYYPNTDGLLFFLREVWPRLKVLRPSVRFRILGPKPPQAIADWPDSAVEVVGYVDDVRPHIARAGAVVVPLRIGGGTRLKILEAMALAQAVVSTRLGAEGLEVRDGHDILLADTPQEIADQLSRVLSSPELAAGLGSAARQLVVERYSWRASAERLLRFYEELGARTA